MQFCKMMLPRWSLEVSSSFSSSRPTWLNVALDATDCGLLPSICLPDSAACSVSCFSKLSFDRVEITRGVKRFCWRDEPEVMLEASSNLGSSLRHRCLSSLCCLSEVLVCSATVKTFLKWSKLIVDWKFLFGTSSISSSEEVPSTRNLK